MEKKELQYNVLGEEEHSFPKLSSVSVQSSFLEFPVMQEKKDLQFNVLGEEEHSFPKLSSVSVQSSVLTVTAIKQTNTAVDAQLKDTQHCLQEATARADASEKQCATSLEKAAKSASDVQAQMQKELNSSRAEIDKLTKVNAEVQAKLKAA